jgi:HEAT repeat protein
MDRKFPQRRATRHRWAMLLGLCALAFGLTALRADDPVDRLREALKIDPTVPDREKQRFDKVTKIFPELQTISQLRRAYFLKEWQQGKLDNVNPKFDIEPFRAKIGAAAVERIRQAGVEPNLDRQKAVLILIAELADADQPAERSPKGKFASVFTDLLVGGGKNGPGLVQNENLHLQQAALSALGKITPKPADIFAPQKYQPLASALRGPNVGPRRLAAYALSELIKNAHYLDPTEEIRTHEESVKTAVFGLRNPQEDDFVRGYCLQAIHASAHVFVDYPATQGAQISPDTAIRFEMEGETLVLNRTVAATLKAYQDACPRLIAALKNDPNFNIRLTALQALTEVVHARMRVMDQLYDKQKEIPADKRPKRDAIFAVFKAPDPISYLFEVDEDAGAGTPTWHWEAVPALLINDKDVRVRRTAMAFLEMVVDDIELAVETKKLEKTDKLAMRRRLVRSITPGLRDPDVFVRWSAARTIRHVALDLIDENIVEALGEMLIDTVNRDPDAASAAALTLQSIASSPYAAKSIRFLKSVIADPEKDTEIREQAFVTLVQIGGTEANAAFPELTAALVDPEVRIRRAATESLGLLGRPATRAIGEAAIAALVERLRDDDAVVRQNASEAILSITLPR